MKSSHRAAAGLAVLAAAVSLAYAAAGQAPSPPDGLGGPPSPDQRAERMHERMEAKAKALHDILGLRPDQEAAFQAFQAAMAPPPREHHGPPDGQAGAAPLTTPQRLDMMADRMARHEAEFHHRAEAIKAFYAALSPDQQRAFDALPMMGDDRHGAGMGPHGPMDHGPVGGPGPGPGAEG